MSPGNDLTFRSDILTEVFTSLRVSSLFSGLFQISLLSWTTGHAPDLQSKTHTGSLPHWDFSHRNMPGCLKKMKPGLLSHSERRRSLSCTVLSFLPSRSDNGISVCVFFRLFSSVFPPQSKIRRLSFGSTFEHSRIRALICVLS